jgi:hypothetical protein
MKRIRKKVENVSQDKHLGLIKHGLDKPSYIKLEQDRKGPEWSHKIIEQEFKCYYCKTDIRTIQQLILNRLIGMRKRGPSGYSGLHFELDHKNSITKDNSKENLVAACYYCNNDKSNTISEEIFLKYFGPQRKVAFDKLFHDNNLEFSDLFVHHLSLSTEK